MIVKAATSYTSYKELWQDALKLDSVSVHDKSGDRTCPGCPIIIIVIIGEQPTRAWTLTMGARP